MKQKYFRLFLLLLLIKITPLYSITTDCEVVKYVTRREVKDNILTQIDTIVFQVNNRNGEKYSDFGVPYSNIEKISDINGWIIDSYGKKVCTLKTSDIEDQSQSSGSTMYSDSYLKTFQLKHSSYPYKVYYTYKLVSNQFTYISYWTPIINFKILTLDAKLYITIPKDYRVKQFTRKATQLRTDTTNKKSNTYAYVSSYDRITLNQEFADPSENIMPVVIVVPLRFVYGVNGSAENWTTFGNWFLDLNKRLLDLPESEEIVINELLKGVTNAKEKTKRLYYYLQDHTRYINVKIGVGGLQAYPASYVAQNKYGDCKALTTYMKALLNYAGIKSYYTLINGSFQPEKLIEDLPFPQFNHIILCVPFEKDTLWLENTSNIEPFGYVSSFIQNRELLFIDENRSRLINMPKIDVQNSFQSRKSNISINISGDADFQTMFLFKGYYFQRYNQMNTYNNKDEQDRFIRDIMPSTNCDLKSWNLEKHQRDLASIGLSASFTLKKFIEPLGSNSYYFELVRIFNYSFEPPSERKIALQIPVPINYMDSTIYSLPQGLDVKSLPDSISISNQFGRYRLRAANEKGVICVYKELLIFPAFYSLDQYKDFYSFIKLIKDAEKKVVVLLKKTSSV